MEEMVDPEVTAKAMSGELVKMANWLELPNIEIRNAGNLAKTILKYH